MTIEITGHEHLFDEPDLAQPSINDTPSTHEPVLASQPQNTAASPVTKVPEIEVIAEATDPVTAGENAINPHAQLMYLGKTLTNIDVYIDNNGEKLYDVPTDILSTTTPPAQTEVDGTESPILGTTTDPSMSGFIKLVWHRDNRYQFVSDGHGLDVAHHGQHAINAIRERLGASTPVSEQPLPGALPALEPSTITVPLPVVEYVSPHYSEDEARFARQDSAGTDELLPHVLQTYEADDEDIADLETEQRSLRMPHITAKALSRTAFYGAGLFLMGKSYYVVTGGDSVFFDVGNWHHLVDGPFGVAESIVQHIAGGIQGGINFFKFI